MGRARRWVRGRPAEVAFWRGLVRFPRSYFVDLHHIVARDSYTARMHILVAGGFTVVGGAVANNIAVYDPATGEWSPLGSGTGYGYVSTLATLPNGDLIAGGSFTTAGGMPANRIAATAGTLPGRHAALQARCLLQRNKVIDRRRGGS